jgi:hypothetical protein
VSFLRSELYTGATGSLQEAEYHWVDIINLPAQIGKQCLDWMDHSWLNGVAANVQH